MSLVLCAMLPRYLALSGWFLVRALLIIVSLFFLFIIFRQLNTLKVLCIVQYQLFLNDNAGHWRLITAIRCNIVVPNSFSYMGLCDESILKCLFSTWEHYTYYVHIFKCTRCVLGVWCSVIVWAWHHSVRLFLVATVILSFFFIFPFFSQTAFRLLRHRSISLFYPLLCFHFVPSWKWGLRFRKSCASHSADISPQFGRFFPDHVYYSLIHCRCHFIKY